MSLKGAIWRETMSSALWLAGAASLVWLGAQLPFWELIILWTILAVGLVIILRRFWSWLLGPLFFYDLVRTARRNRLIPIRCFYAPAILLFLWITYSRWFGFHWNDWQQLFEPPLIRRNLLSGFASTFFMSFGMLLISTAFLLTPIYTAPAVVEERERGNLDLLLVTPLTSREIVLGLMMSRLATLSLILATGLPILSFLPFLGGVDPRWVVSTFVLAGSLMVVQASVSIYASVRAPNSLRAIMDAFLHSFVLGGFLFCCSCLWGFASYPSTVPFVPSVIPSLSMCMITGGFICFFFSGFAVARLRASVTKVVSPRLILPVGRDSVAIERSLPSKEKLHLYWAIGDLFRFPIIDPLMLWKDLHRKRTENVQTLFSVLPMCFYVFLSGFVLVRKLLWSGDLISASNMAIRYIGPWVNCLLLFPVVIISARMVSQEREKRTLESLLLTDLDPREILFGKWWASVLPMRWILVVQAVALGITAQGGSVKPTRRPHPSASPPGMMHRRWHFFVFFLVSLPLPG